MRWEDELGPLKDLAIGGRERGASGWLHFYP